MLRQLRDRAPQLRLQVRLRTTRLGAGLGPDADPRTLSALEMTYFGALVHAGSGVVTYHQIADRLSYVVGLIIGDDK